MDNEISARLEKVETHLAHLEHHYDQLNQALVEQSKLLLRLQSHQQRLSQSIETIELQRIKETNPKPPHYQ